MIWDYCLIELLLFKVRFNSLFIRLTKLKQSKIGNKMVILLKQYKETGNVL